MNPSHKFLLIAVTAISVVSDSMLIPFYPQYFSHVFDISSAAYVGFYLAIYCLVVMLAFPFWAKIAKRVAILPLLVVTQSIAACLSSACHWANDVSWFWLISLLMMTCKASYLLIYPFILSRELPEKHGFTIGILAVVVEFGAILGALAGGVFLQWFDPRRAFLLMAAGDVLQVLACVWLILQGLKDAPTPTHSARPVNNRRELLQLGLVKVLFFFSAFLGYHFFTRYWSELTAQDNALLSGAVFSVPAAMALLGLIYNHFKGKRLNVSSIYGNTLLAVVGALLQALPDPLWVFCGRLIFGWALFQTFVRLDLFLFQLSHPSQYSEDYSLLRIAQNTGVLLAVYLSGYIVSYWGGMWMFVCSAVGLSLSMIVFLLIFGKQPAPSKSPTLSSC